MAAARCPALLPAHMPVDRVVPPERLSQCKQHDVCPSGFLTLLRVWDELNRTFPAAMSSYVQNVGANDGVGDDPLYPLLRYRKIAALAIEADRATYERLQSNMASLPHVRTSHLAISPSTAAAALAHPSGNSMDVFKLDIDGCECHILELLLRSSPSWRPKIIQLELNHVLPPPLAYRDMCKDDAPGRSAVPYEANLDVWGCSMQAA